MESESGGSTKLSKEKGPCPWSWGKTMSKGKGSRRRRAQAWWPALASLSRSDTRPIAKTEESGWKSEFGKIKV